MARPSWALRATHGFDLRPFLKTNTGKTRLREVIGRLPGRKVVLTNGPGCYARAVVKGLNLSNLFAGVISASDMHLCGKWRSKPDPMLFAHAAHAFGARPCQTLFIDDNAHNLAAAKALGMFTVWSRGYRNEKPVTAAHPWADLVVENLDELLSKFMRARS